MEQFRRACQLLPRYLCGQLWDNPRGGETEEIRLRTGCPPTLSGGWGEVTVGGTQVGREDLEAVVRIATEYSPYTAEESMRAGYLTAAGGFRIGLCGSVTAEGDGIRCYRELSSLCIRIPREKKGIAAACAGQWLAGGMPNLLILGAPGEGKTTFLRDMIRCVSAAGVRVGLCDERGEIAALFRGQPQLDVGERTDVLEGCAKATAVSVLLKTMSPRVIAVDEVALAADAEALVLGAGSGAALMATVHGSSTVQLRQKQVLRGLLEEGIFPCVVRIFREGGCRRYIMEELS